MEAESESEDDLEMIVDGEQQIDTNLKPNKKKQRESLSIKRMDTQDDPFSVKKVCAEIIDEMVKIVFEAEEVDLGRNNLVSNAYLRSNAQNIHKQRFVKVKMTDAKNPKSMESNLTKKKQLPQG